MKEAEVNLLIENISYPWYYFKKDKKIQHILLDGNPLTIDNLMNFSIKIDKETPYGTHYYMDLYPNSMSTMVRHNDLYFVDSIDFEINNGSKKLIPRIKVTVITKCKKYGSEDFFIKKSKGFIMNEINTSMLNVIKFYYKE